MDEGAGREEISEELKAKGDAEMLAEGADTVQSGHYDLAGSYPMLTDGLMRYATRRRERTLTPASRYSRAGIVTKIKIRRHGGGRS